LNRAKITFGLVTVQSALISNNYLPDLLQDSCFICKHNVVN